MFRVDVDAHVDESEATWEYLDESEKRFKPLTLDPGAATVPGDARPHRLWVIDGNIRLRRWRDDKRTGTVKATRELLDVDARIRHMDELRIDVQVLVGGDDGGGHFRPRQELAVARGDEIGADARADVAAAVGALLRDADPFDRRMARRHLATEQPDAAGADDGEPDTPGVLPHRRPPAAAAATADSASLLSGRSTGSLSSAEMSAAV